VVGHELSADDVPEGDDVLLRRLLDHRCVIGVERGLRNRIVGPDRLLFVEIFVVAHRRLILGSRIA
jgi:hypothetical protein